MPSISADDDELDELVYDLVTSDDGQKEIAEELLSKSLEYDSVVQAEVIEVIHDATGYNKDTIRDWKGELQNARAFDLLGIEGITKVTRYAPEDPILYEFTVDTPNTDGLASFRLSSDDLLSPTKFEQKVLELTDTLVEFDDWNEVLNQWLREHDIATEKEEPLDIEHSVTEAVVDRIRAMEPVVDIDDFKQNPDTVMVRLGRNEAQISATVIDSATREVQGETNRQKIRAILDDLMVGGEARKVRVGDDHFRAWRFDLERLEDADVLDVEHLREDDEDDT